MAKIKTRSRWAYIPLLLILVVLFINYEPMPGHKPLKYFLIKKLYSKKNLPAEKSNRSENAIYVLGGSQSSLKSRLMNAAELYRRKAAGRIFIFYEETKTEYDPVERRNLIKNEWSVKRLSELGVDPENIELLKINEGFFGTYSEAKEVPQLISGKGYKRLILVSSPYHMARVFSAFSRFSMDRQLELYLYGSTDEIDLNGLILEYFKFLTYETLLLK
ncbi:MAG: YdcF family protein [Deltaproteobacteria bacterium]|nr:YdcF family protein [Deltaproteobacteria bacterium]